MNKIFALLTIIFASTLTAGCEAPAYQWGYQAQPSYEDQNRQGRADQMRDNRDAKANVVTDQDINKEVKDTIGSGWFSKGYERVSYDVRGGTVTLKGNVNSEEDKAKIEKKIGELEGVQKVNNEINVVKPAE